MQAKITLPFVNNRLLRDTILKDSRNILVLLIYVDLMCISFVLIYEKGRWAFNVKKYEKRWKIYLYLGIPKKQFTIFFLREFLSTSLCSVVCAVLSMIVYHYSIYRLKWSGGQGNSISIMGERVLKIFLNRVSWEGIMVSTILILGFITIKTIYKVKKVLKNFKM